MPSKTTQFKELFNRQLWLWGLVLSQLIAVPYSGVSQTVRDEASEDYFISMFLLNTLYYGQWPGPQDWKSNKVARIGIFGRNTLQNSIYSVANDFKNQRFSEGSITITNSSKADDLAECHVIYFAETNPTLVRYAIKQFRQKPILLVGSSKGFAEQGGTFEIILEPEKQPNYVLNIDRLNESKISLGSQLRIRVSTHIENGKRSPNKHYKKEVP